MASIKDILSVACPACKKFTPADLLDCGCIIGKCQNCGCDTEDTKECAN